LRFLGDACIDIRVIKWLRSQGYDATHLREEGLQRLPDEEIFKKAISENRVIASGIFQSLKAMKEAARQLGLILQLRNNALCRELIIPVTMGVERL